MSADSSTLRVVVNGETKMVSPGSVLDALNRLGFELAHSAVAVNEVVVHRARWSEQALNEGDRIEVLSPMSGG